MNKKMKFVATVATLLVVAAGVITFEACNKKDFIIATDSCISQEDIVMKNLLDSIDALNEKYPANQIRGSFWGGFVVGGADMAGASIGGGIGGWLGGLAGSLGGPVGTYLGIVIGQHVGPYICGALASGAANVLFSSGANTIYNNDDYQFVYIVSNEDSIGYYHNYLMTELNRNKNRYYSASGSVDYDLMYQDIVNYLHDIGRYDEALEDSIVKHCIINQVKSICLISEKYFSNPDGDELIEEQCDFLKNQCHLQDAEVNMYRNYSAKLLNKCITLDNSQIECYSHDLNEIISNSDVTQAKKEELSLYADFIINSALYWNTNY